MTRQRVTNAQLRTLCALIAVEARKLGLMGERDTLTLDRSHPREGIPYRLSIRHDNGTRARFAPADGDGGALGLTARDAQRTLATILHTLRAVSQAQRDRETDS